jgi:hypothetical protein
MEGRLGKEVVAMAGRVAVSLIESPGEPFCKQAVRKEAS